MAKSLRGVIGCALLLVPGLAVATLQVTVGTSPGNIVLTGRLATPDEVIDGKVVIEGDTITCAGTGCTDPAGATVIRVTNANILPGFIDAHNHVAYNVFPKWLPPKLYDNRFQWQRSTSYQTFKAPYNGLKAAAYCEMVKYGEIKALISGVTTIQGTSPDRMCFRTLIRNAENRSELNVSNNHIRTHILAIDSFRDQIDWNVTQAFIVHLSEGIDASSRAEFETLKQKNLLKPGTVIIHGTAFGATEFEQMSDAGAKLIWSPQSNLVLYGKTTDIKAALAKGVKVSLGVDWNPSGSDTLFAELRVADTVNQEEFDGAIPDSDWLKMITTFPAEAMALQDHIGRLAPNLKADITIVRRRDTDANQSLLKNALQDVELVIVGGTALYGTRSALDRLRPGQCEALTIRGSSKRICVSDPRPGVEKSGQTLAEIRQILQSHYNGLAPLDP